MVIFLKTNRDCLSPKYIHTKEAGSRLGIHIVSAVAAQLREKGYRVALGSRNPRPTSDDDLYFNVKVDVQKRESIDEVLSYTS
jgi:hypothetical protein